MTASWWRSVAGPGAVRDSMMPIAHGWRSSVARSECARRRIAAAQSRVGRQLDLGEDRVDHAVENVVLVRDVVIQRHRLHAQRLGQLAHGQRLDAVGVGERDRGGERPRPADGPGDDGSRGHRGRSSRSLGGRPVDNLTTYGMMSQPYDVRVDVEGDRDERMAEPHRRRHATAIRTDTDARSRAALRTAHADVLQLGTIEQPQIGADEVLVEVRAAGLDRGTWHLMTGVPYAARLAFGLRAPRNPVPGHATSPASSPQIGSTSPGSGRATRCTASARASFAEFAAAKETKLALKPARLTFEQAAAVPVSGLTAQQGLLDVGRLVAGQHVLITGASGGVGTFAVQIAKAARCDGHRRVQHVEDRPRPLARRRPRHRLHHDRLRRRRRSATT